MTTIIAEVKTCSPFGWKSPESWETLFGVAHDIGDILSIHTDQRWGGSFDILRRARQLTSKPILAKGIHATDDQVARAVELGADYVLVVGRSPAIYPSHCLLEPLTIAELRAYQPTAKVVWNSRNLADGSVKRERFSDARSVFKGWMCQASNIRTWEDVATDAQAVLVGTNLRSFAESVRVLRK